jgi:hypothetical protein
MPLVGFICPDGEKTSIADCLAEGGCRYGDRCASRTYLQMASQERPWTGVPSVTQLIAGTMLSYLRIAKETWVVPEDRSYMLHGTIAHAQLELDDDFSLLEEKMKAEIVELTGIPDIYEVEKGVRKLIDRKTSGSYKVVKALGFYKESVIIPGQFFKKGPREGEPKTRKVVRQSDEHIDRWEWELQQNMYRIMLEQHGFPVDSMWIECIPRDGGTYVAYSRGINKRLYLFEINRLPDKQVLEYFKRKRRALLYALKYGWTRPCTNDENWEGIRCKRFCEVAEHCPLGKYFIEEKEKLAMPIEGLTEVVRPQISGKIRLGRKVPNANGNGEHPEELSWFRFDPNHIQDESLKAEVIEDFRQVYGNEPTMLNVIFPSSDREVIFPQYYNAYGQSSGLKCDGDGKTAECKDEKMLKNLDRTGKNGKRGFPEVICKGAGQQGNEETTCCPYFKEGKGKMCNRVARLRFMLPDLKGTTMWECVTGSINSIININSAFKHLEDLGGRFDWVPLQLMRIPMKMTKDGKQRTHYPLAIDMYSITLRDILNYARMEPMEILEAQYDFDDDRQDLAFSGEGDPTALPEGKQAALPEKVEDTDQVPKTFGDVCQRLAEDWNEDTDVIRGFLLAKLETEEAAYERIITNLSDDKWMEDTRRLFGQWVVAESRIDESDETIPEETEEEPETPPEKPKEKNGNGQNGKSEFTYASMAHTLAATLGIEDDPMKTFIRKHYGNKAKATLNLKKIIDDDGGTLLEKFEEAYSEWEKQQGSKDETPADDEQPLEDADEAQDDRPM